MYNDLIESIERALNELGIQDRQTIDAITEAIINEEDC